MDEQEVAPGLAKRQREQIILRMVYNEDEFEVVDHRDAPDFSLKRHSSEPFGVEVTEIYETESHARAINRPEYVGELLAGGRHIHKDDLSVLDVVYASITSPEGVTKQENVPVIINERPTSEQRAQALAEAITSKSAKFTSYEGSFSHVNLIILDHFDLRQNQGSRYATEDLLTGDVRNALLVAPFREIHLISEFKNGRHACRPLRLLLLLEQFELYIGALDTFEGREGLELADVVPLFVRVAERRGVVPVWMSIIDGLAYAVCGGAAISHDGEGVRVLDFHDHNLPDEASLPPASITDEEFEEFVQHFGRYVMGNSFVTTLAVDVVNGANI